MRIQSINQNNYQNNRQKDIGFKMNFCIEFPKIPCRRNNPCDNFMRSMGEEGFEIIKGCLQRVGGSKYGIVENADRNNIRTLIIDEATLRNIDQAADQTARDAILDKVKDGEIGEIITVDTQRICDCMQTTCMANLSC